MGSFLSLFSSPRNSVTTGALKRAPRHVTVVARTTRNVTIQWMEDECAKAYVIGVYYLNSGEFRDYIRFKPLETPKSQNHR